MSCSNAYTGTYANADSSTNADTNANAYTDANANRYLLLLFS